MRRDDLPPLERAVSDTLDEYLSRHHGIVTSNANPEDFLDWLRENGHAVVPIAQAEGRSKVYVATSGEYSDYGICHAFARQEDAQSYELGDAFEEFDVHDGPIEVRTQWFLYWYPQGQAGQEPAVHSRRWDFDGHPNRATHEWGKNGLHVPFLTVSGWDRERVLKVYSEQRAQYIARRDMGVEEVTAAIHLPTPEPEPEGMVAE